MFIIFFFFKQKTAYEMLRSLVGSEMCIRDRLYPVGTPIRVLGKLVSESWGNGKYVDVVWCNDVQFLQPLEEIMRNIEEEVENELEEVETDDELAPF